VRNAMKFGGISTTQVGKGQITDDSELEISLLYGLIEAGNKNEYSKDTVAQRYLQWFHSDPFDVGTTTRNALYDAHDADSMMENATLHNENSLSNGALMRSAALSAYYWHLKPYELLEIGKRDAQLTHTQPAVLEINGLYVAVLGALIQCAINKERPDGDIIIQWMCETARETETKEWIQMGLSLTSLENYDALQNCGHVKHAFIMLIYFLNHIEKYSYETAIMETLMCGGDTDTNSKIVGSLFGAYYPNCIPAKILNTVLEFDCTTPHNNYPRPTYYSVLHVIRYLRIHKTDMLNESVVSKYFQNQL